MCIHGCSLFSCTQRSASDPTWHAHIRTKSVGLSIGGACAWPLALNLNCSTSVRGSLAEFTARSLWPRANYFKWSGCAVGAQLFVRDLQKGVERCFLHVFVSACKNDHWRAKGRVPASTRNYCFLTSEMANACATHVLRNSWEPSALRSWAHWAMAGGQKPNLGGTPHFSRGHTRNWHARILLCTMFPPRGKAEV